MIRAVPLILAVSLLAQHCQAAGDDATAVSAKDLAARLAAIEEGTSNVRLKMEVQGSGGANTELQLQIKQRRSNGSTDLVYQVLWPKERKDEAVILHQGGGRVASGVLVAPPNKPKTLGASDMGGALFGSDLNYEDAADNFFAWSSQAIVGNENVNRADCVILESKPGGGDHSTYAKVRTWVDAKRLVPMRVEKYFASGKVARRIDTTRVVNDDKGRPIPANLTVHGSRGDSVTELDGSRIKHDVTYSDRDFSPEGLSATAGAKPEGQ